MRQITLLHSSRTFRCMAAFILPGKEQMQMKLVLAEKPSVAQSIAKVLGATKREDGYLEGHRYIVSWCVGRASGRITTAGSL